LDFLAGGGDGFEMFMNQTVQKFEKLDIDVFIEYMKKKSPIHPAVEWRIKIKDFMDPAEEVIGSTLVLLDSNCSQSECNLGNFITDAMVDWHALKYDNPQFWTDASIAFIQGSEIKTSIDATTNNGEIVRREAENVFGAAINLVTVTLTGAELKQILEYSVSALDNATNAQFLQMSGIQVVFDMNKPAGQRVTDTKVLCAQCIVPELEALKIDGEYNVILQSTLASGADGYRTIFGSREARDLGDSDVNVFIEYLRKKSPVYPAVEWRITIIPDETPPTEGPTTTQGASSLSLPMILVTFVTTVSLIFGR